MVQPSGQPATPSPKPAGDNTLFDRVSSSIVDMVKRVKEMEKGVLFWASVGVISVVVIILITLYVTRSKASGSSTSKGGTENRPSLPDTAQPSPALPAAQPNTSGTVQPSPPPQPLPFQPTSSQVSDEQEPLRDQVQTSTPTTAIVLPITDSTLPTDTLPIGPPAPILPHLPAAADPATATSPATPVLPADPPVRPTQGILLENLPEGVPFIILSPWVAVSDEISLQTG